MRSYGEELILHFRGRLSDASGAWRWDYTVGSVCGSCVFVSLSAEGDAAGLKEGDKWSWQWK